MDQPQRITATVHSTYGDYDISEDGMVVSGPAYYNHRRLVRFDLSEYKKHYGNVDTEYDIIDVGFWHADGSYVPPERTD